MNENRILWKNDFGSDYSHTLDAAIDLIKRKKVDVLFGPPRSKGINFLLHSYY